MRPANRIKVIFGETAGIAAAQVGMNQTAGIRSLRPKDAAQSMDRGSKWAVFGGSQRNGDDDGKEAGHGAWGWGSLIRPEHCLTARGWAKRGRIVTTTA